MMQVLTPSLAARFAAISYSTDTTDGVEGSAYYGALSRHFDFDSDSVKGISGLS